MHLGRLLPVTSSFRTTMHYCIEIVIIYGGVGFSLCYNEIIISFSGKNRILCVGVI